jgi:transposase-like protein
MAPRLAEWQELNGPESLTISSMPVGHRRRPRTSKPMERLNEGIERRTRVQDLFPNEASAFRLIVARSPASPRRAGERRQVPGLLPTRLTVVTIEPRRR